MFARPVGAPEVAGYAGIMADAPGAVLAVFMRWLHIASVVALIGGFLYARFGVWPALASLDASAASLLVESMVSRFRAILYTILATTLISGVYNYATKPSYPPHYHMIIGFKLLLVLHIFSMAVLYTLPDKDMMKRRRWLTSMVISGLVVIAISADLRWLSLNTPAVRP